MRSLQRLKSDLPRLNQSYFGTKTGSLLCLLLLSFYLTIITISWEINLLFLDCFWFLYLYHSQMLYHFSQHLFHSTMILLILSIFSPPSSFGFSELQSSICLSRSVNEMMWCLSRSTFPASRKTLLCFQIKSDLYYFQRCHCLFPCSSESAIADSAPAASLFDLSEW